LSCWGWTRLIRVSHHFEQSWTKLAVAQGSRQVSEAKLRQEEAAANAIANQIEAEEKQAEKKQKKKKSKNKRK